MKVLLAFAIVGLLSGTSGVLADAIHAAAGVDMPWFAQFGLCGLFGFILFYTIAKLLPSKDAAHNKAMVEVAKVHADAKVEAARIMSAAMDGLAEEFRALRDDQQKNGDATRAEIRAGNDSQLALLRASLLHSRTVIRDHHNNEDNDQDSDA
jgi:hypothetical protein